MHRSFLAVLCLLCALFGAGCAKAAATLPAVPENAVRLYTYDAQLTDGRGITTDAWHNPDDTGFFVVELQLTSGSIGKMELRRAGGGTVASLGSAAEDRVLITDLLTDAAGDYVLYLGQADSFVGELNLYFVPGIGYSVAD